MNLATLVPWYGSDRQVAPQYARRLAGRPWIGIPYSGPASIVRELRDATTIIANDLHCDVINLCQVVDDDDACKMLVRRLETTPFHRNEFENAQLWIANDRFDCFHEMSPLERPRIERAAHYFVASWMGRNGEAGTTSEARTTFSVRYDAGGGDSAVRYRAAVDDLRSWCRQFDRVTFECRDALEMLDDCKDLSDCGLYIDMPWPKGGKRYRHRFDEQHFKMLETKLRTFQETAVVVRSSNCRVTRERFTEDYWHTDEITSRSQANRPVAELLITPKHQADAGPLFSGVECDETSAVCGGSL